MRKAFHIFFNKKYWHISDINVWNFNETLTNNVVSFDQPDPGQQGHSTYTVKSAYVVTFIKGSPA